MDLLYRNILLTHENVIKLADLGAARVIEKSILANTYTGTVEYMSPEQLKREYSFPTDIWY